MSYERCCWIYGERFYLNIEGYKFNKGTNVPPWLNSFYLNIEGYKLHPIRIKTSINYEFYLNIEGYQSPSTFSS